MVAIQPTTASCFLPEFLNLRIVQLELASVLSTGKVINTVYVFTDPEFFVGLLFLTQSQKHNINYFGKGLNSKEAMLTESQTSNGTAHVEGG